ncbi:MAG TPA: signal peptidase I [Bacillales bacterium]
MKTLGKLFAFFIFVFLVGTSLYFHYGTPPFSAIPSKSMVPTFHVGDLVVIEDITPDEVKVGDIIVVDVPEAVGERFGYPPNIIHRVIKVERSGGKLQFRVKGDNNGGEDPFTVLPEYIMGAPGASYPYLGYPILFMNSPQGFYFLISALGLYLLYVVFEELNRHKISLRHRIASFFFADVFSRTKQIEEGQEKVLEILTKRYSSPETAFAVEPDEEKTLDSMKKQFEEDRLFISKMAAESGGDHRYKAILKTLADLEAKIDAVMKEVNDSYESAGSLVGNQENEDEDFYKRREFPPRRAKKKSRGLFKRR